MTFFVQFALLFGLMSAGANLLLVILGVPLKMTALFYIYSGLVMMICSRIKEVRI